MREQQVAAFKVRSYKASVAAVKAHTQFHKKNRTSWTTRLKLCALW